MPHVVEAESTGALAPNLPPVPEPGQVVNVRGSTWAVTDVRQQGLPRSPADEGTAQLTHVVSLQSLEEDRLGEELAVVWELEVRACASSRDRPTGMRMLRVGADDRADTGSVII
ncbi:hypothetical protein, partial [Streptomyces sp. NPDC004533]|uniref:hypothetical protein n=1 Tax=Streptomyces sp. NPDC004533 TaxID=3154278 RepID=UPI0033A66815